MIFSKSRPVKIVLVGTGGTGGYIVPQLYRLLYALDRPIRVILCDGDLVEEKNLGRQNFIEADLGKNKAMVLAERYSNAFGIETSYIPQYVEDEEMLEELLEPLQYPQNRYVTNQNGEAVRKVISEIVILIGAVDNNRSRQVFHSVFQRAKELIYIDSGNSKASGQVICGVRRSGKTFYQPVASLYPEVLEQTDKFPTELSCAEASISAPQTIWSIPDTMTPFMGRRNPQSRTIRRKRERKRALKPQSRTRGRAAAHPLEILLPNGGVKPLALAMGSVKQISWRNGT